MILSLEILHEFSHHFLSGLTARVTCAGAGGGTPSDEKKAEAKKMPVKRADSPASSARFVSPQMRHCSLVMRFR